MNRVVVNLSEKDVRSNTLHVAFSVLQVFLAQLSRDLVLDQCKNLYNEMGYNSARIKPLASVAQIEKNTFHPLN